MNLFNYLEGGRGRKPPAKGIKGIGIIGTPIFRPGKGKLFDYPNLSDYSSDYSIDIKYFFNYRPLIILFSDIFSVDKGFELNIM